MVEAADEGPRAVLERLVTAVNAHDLEGLVSCFAEGYVNETPAHPQRGFCGNEQVRRNWTHIFAGVTDIRALVPRSAVDGDTLWTEWELSGTRTDGARFLMHGVVIFAINRDEITSARFYLEPVEENSGDVNTHTRRVVGSVGRSDSQEVQS